MHIIQRRHAGSVALQFFEPVYPEIFINVQIAVIALRRAGVGAEKMQLRPVREHDRITLQLDSALAGKFDDIATKNQRL
ncbi:hypothetical protein D3C79_904110 [compost metagenome]